MSGRLESDESESLHGFLSVISTNTYSCDVKYGYENKNT